MRSQFSDAEVDAYRRDGFLTVEDFLEPGELARWREIVTDAVASRAPGADGQEQREGLYPADAPASHRRPAAKLVDDPGVGRLVAQLEGLSSVRLYLDQALVKEPYGAPTQYHLDIPWWGFDSEHACTIWVALDDATVENGCLYFVPGQPSPASGHCCRSWDPSTVRSSRHTLRQLNQRSRHRSPPVAARSTTGTRSMAAGANMTPGRRRAMTIAFRATPTGGLSRQP